MPIPDAILHAPTFDPKLREAILAERARRLEGMTPVQLLFNELLGHRAPLEHRVFCMSTTRPDSDRTLVEARLQLEELRRDIEKAAKEVARELGRDLTEHEWTYGIRKEGAC